MYRKKISPLTLNVRVLMMLSVVIMLCCFVPVSAVSDTITVFTTAAGDGRVERMIPTSTTFSDIRDGPGTTGYSTGNDSIARIESANVSNEFNYMDRGVLIFNTSALPDDATITSAKIGMYVIERNITLGNSNISLTKFTVAGTINSSDYQNFNDILLTDEKNISTMPSFQYHNFTLNALGRSNISLTGESGFGVRTTFDINNVQPTWVERAATFIRFNTAENVTFAPFIEISYTNTTGPVASFSATPQTGPIPLSVQFNDTSINTPTSWNWSFGDGTWFNTTAAAERNATYVYNTPGSYIAQLTVSNSAGTSTTVPGTTITVSQGQPVASFSATPQTGIIPLSVQFNDTSINTPTSWNWSFGDGTWFNTTVAAERNATYMYNTPGNFIAQLTVSNVDGTSTTVPGTTITVSSPTTGGPFSIGVFRPSVHTFYLKNGTALSWTTTAINWGASTDLPVTGDWNGDGMTDIGVFRPSTHIFYLKNGTLLSWTTTAINWGASTDLPVTGDWNGDGMTDIGVYRPSTHMFYLKNGTLLSWTTTAINWGASTDLPVTGDWNGDNMTDIGVYRPSTHMFYLKNGTALSWTTTAINWGASTDLPVTGDWNGDGMTDIGVFRPSTHMFYLKNGTALSWTTTAINWGASTDNPVTGKWG
jgi:PKD repeat protein